MKIKQKAINLSIFLAIVVGFASILLVPALQDHKVYAQQTGLDCSELTEIDLTACEDRNEEVNDNLAEDERQRNLDTRDGAQDCGDVRVSIVRGDFCDDSGEGGVIFGLLKWVLRIMTGGIAIAAVGGIAYGALLYTTAENKPDQTKKAIGVITNVVVGIAAYALMAVFLNFLIPGGIFN